MENELFNVICNIVIDYATKMEMSEQTAKDTFCMEQGASEELWERIIAEPRVRSAFN